MDAIKKSIINPVECREADLALPETLAMEYTIPTDVVILDGFTELDEEGLKKFIADYGLAMDLSDLKMCRDYFLSEKRNPTITEIRMIDTYWSDHCRHTTFGTIIDDVKFEDELLQKAYEDYIAVRRELGRTKPICMMDLATIAVRYLKANGKLDKLDESEEVNACTVKIDVDIEGRKEPWLLLFKNETHNHPTEIEPFGGAATCVGGAIRDPLSGRAYVYAAMRVTGAGDPLAPLSETIPGKIPQRKLTYTAAAGYSSYGNQIGLTTGMVDEIYHPGYVAKRMEIGAVVAAAPAENVIREVPAPGDVVILLGGGTGRDGIGGATGSSKAHDSHSVETCGAEVQKGNAPEERKIQRLFRDGSVTKLIKRCNDFGAGGVSVAIGELADGLDINLNAVPKKYEGLDGTELAISESQERMACVVAAENADKFIAMAAKENLNAVVVATVKAEKRLTINWNGKAIVDISREFLNSNGAEKHIKVELKAAKAIENKNWGEGFENRYMAVASDLNCCSKKGMADRFDSSVGVNTVLMPFGGKNQLTPIQSMVHKVAVEKQHTDTCSFMAWGYNPFITEQSPYHGAYLAVVESVSKLIATGAEFKDVYLSFQEYFEKLGTDPKRWGKPVAALLGAFKAQMDLGIGSIGGKDSMSGTFENLDVPPTLVSFAITTDDNKNVISPEFKKAGSAVIRIAPEKTEAGLPCSKSLMECFARVTELMRAGKVLACYTPGMGGVAEAVLKMAIGNGYGFEYSGALSEDEMFGYDYGAFILEVTEVPEGAQLIGKVTAEESMVCGGVSIPMAKLCAAYEDKLEPVFPSNIKQDIGEVKNFEYRASSWPAPAIKVAKPKFVIPAFPGTNCEYDTAKAVIDAGGEPEIIVVKNLTADAVAKSVEEFAAAIKGAQAISIPGGFSGGDEPDGSGKFITAFFRNEAIKEQVTELLEKRDGLMCGICNGAQALIKMGLVPYGKIIDTTEKEPTLTFNYIARHQNRITRVRVASNKSPWLSLADPDQIYNVAISHGEGRFVASPEMIAELEKNGQIATQYVDFDGNASGDIRHNPNGSTYAIEGITSPDGRVFARMGHVERSGKGLMLNVPGVYDMKMFEAAVKYFK